MQDFIFFLHFHFSPFIFLHIPDEQKIAFCAKKLKKCGNYEFFASVENSVENVEIACWIKGFSIFKQSFQHFYFYFIIKRRIFIKFLTIFFLQVKLKKSILIAFLCGFYFLFRIIISKSRNKLVTFFSSVSDCYFFVIFFFRWFLLNLHKNFKLRNLTIFLQLHETFFWKTSIKKSPAAPGSKCLRLQKNYGFCPIIIS